MGGRKAGGERQHRCRFVGLEWGGARLTGTGQRARDIVSICPGWRQPSGLLLPQFSFGVIESLSCVPSLSHRVALSLLP